MTLRFKVFCKAGNPPRAGSAIYSSIYVRLRDGRGIDQTVRTNILIRYGSWDPVHECIRAKVGYPPQERATVDSSVSKLRAHITTTYVSDKIDGRVSPLWLSDCVRAYYREANGVSFHDLFDQFIKERDLSPQRVKQYRSLENIIIRFQIHMTEQKKGNWVFNISKVNKEVLDSFVYFLGQEHELCKTNRRLQATYPNGKPPRPRGKNTISDLFKKLRAFFNWCVHTGIISTSPFETYNVGQELYGTPVCLTMDEVHRIAEKSFGRNVHLARQRDIFVFQCNVGCRVSDLIRLRKKDVVEGAISFIPTKTIKENARTVVVPLNSIAAGIVERYAGNGDEKLLPFISVQKYNIAIKTVLEKCGITREVTTLDPLTRTEMRVRICDIASSHMARRTFVNSIYKKVKDPALVSALTGHVEGSKAFSRYRDIDEDVKRELVELLE